MIIFRDYRGEGFLFFHSSISSLFLLFSVHLSLIESSFKSGLVKKQCKIDVSKVVQVRSFS
mgnify:CR=1 FL=1